MTHLVAVISQLCLAFCQSDGMCPVKARSQAIGRQDVFEVHDGELLAEARPGLSLVAVFWEPTTGPVQVEAAETAAKSRGLRLQIIKVPDLSGLEDAFRAAEREQAQGLLILSSPLFSAVIGSKPLAELAALHRLPAITLFPEFLNLAA